MKRSIIDPDAVKENPVPRYPELDPVDLDPDACVDTFDGITFYPIEIPEQLQKKSDLAKWHIKHGIVYRVYAFHHAAPTLIGQCYLTLLAYSGAIIHFEIVQWGPQPWHVNPADLLQAFRIAVSFLPPHFNIFLTTIPRKKKRLIRIAQRLGFVPVPDMQYIECGEPVTVLRFVGRKD